MSDIVSSLEEPPGESKYIGKHKWRGKFFSTDSKFGRAAKNLDKNNDDIADFLHTASSKPEAGARSTPLVARVDVATGSRQPAAASVTQEDRIVDVYRRPKPRQNKGLCVTFDSALPVVIGVGGDEAELPSRDVMRSSADSLRSEQSPNPEHPDCNASDQYPKAHGLPPDRYNETCFQTSSLQESTGVDYKPVAEESHHAGHDRGAFQSAFPGIRNLSSQPGDGKHDLYLSLRKREVRNGSYISSAAKEEDASHSQSLNQQTVETRSQRVTQQSDVPSPEDYRDNSLDPSNSPESRHGFEEASSSGHQFPSATRDPRKLPDAGYQRVHQDSLEPSQPKDTPVSLLSAAKSLEDDSLEDFDSRVRRFNDLFRLNASAHVDIMTMPFERWIKISAWWFLRGKGGLERAVRAKVSAIAPANAPNDGELSLILKQAYFSLAKAWWILEDVTPNLPAIRKYRSASTSSIVAVMRSYGDSYVAELFEVRLTILANMRALTTSMKRNGRLPPDNLQMQRLESQIFLENPTFPPEIAALTANNLLDPTIKGKKCIKHPFFPILVEDTSRHFNFCNIFVEVILIYRDDPKSRLPCIVSILRERTDWAVKAAVASQDGQVNIVIQSGEHDGLDWHGVQWKLPLHMMQLGIAEGTYLQVQFTEKDFKTIWGICDYTQRIRKEYSARRGEQVVYDRELPIVQCFDCPSFPAEPVKDCRVRLFKRTPVATGDSGQQDAHGGYRLTVITPPGIKTLSMASYQLRKDSPIFFGTHRSKGGNTLLVRVPSSLRVSLTFHEASDLEILRSILSGTSITEDDHCSVSLQLQDFTIRPLSADQNLAYTNASRCIDELRWHKLRVVRRESAAHGQDSQSKVHSEHLRILTDCDFGTFTDRINAGPGELQLNLSVEKLSTIKLRRAAQQDMTWSLADGVLGETYSSSLSDVLHSIGTSPSVMTYNFRSLSDLHIFQATLTGCHVLYDGLASTFSISRRRMVVPVHKHWEASTTRLQIVKQDKTTQLVAFFKEFSHGKCMNFVLKVTDCFETFTRSAVFLVRFVDAKFSLPKGDLDSTRDFVCLDMPEYPGEHDDIIIGFDNEQGRRLKKLTGSRAKEFWANQAADRDKFTQELPAPVNKISRMVSLRR